MFYNFTRTIWQTYTYVICCVGTRAVNGSINNACQVKTNPIHYYKLLWLTFNCSIKYFHFALNPEASTLMICIPKSMLIRTCVFSIASARLHDSHVYVTSFLYKTLNGTIESHTHIYTIFWVIYIYIYIYICYTLYMYI